MDKYVFFQYLCIYVCACVFECVFVSVSMCVLVCVRACRRVCGVCVFSSFSRVCVCCLCAYSHLYTYMHIVSPVVR